MDPASLNQQLSRISTMWTLLHQAHGGQADAATSAQRALMQRYCGAVYRYLLGALRQEDAAVDLFQEFALRFIRGDFRRADPAKGRFRDYVKTSLIHLVTDFHRAQRARPRALPNDFADPSTPAGESEFESSWREELINKTWEALAQFNPTYHEVLSFHVQNPDVTSSEMAKTLAVKLDRPFTPGQVRVTLHRAREKFADLLVEEVALSLEGASEELLREELDKLQLARICASALQRRGSQGESC